MQPPAARDLRGEHARRRRFRHVEHDLVGQNRGAVQHSGRPQSGVLDSGDQARGGAGLGDVAGDHLDPAARGGQSAIAARHLALGRRTPVEHNHSRALLDQPSREDETEAAHATDHDVSAVAPYQWMGGGAATASTLPPAGIEMTILPMWLPDAISRNASIALSRLNSVTGSICSSPSRDMAEDLLEQPPVPRGLQPQIQVEVDHGERGAFRQRGQPQRGVGVDVLLAEFDEPAAGGQDLHAAPNRLSRQAN